MAKTALHLHLCIWKTLLSKATNFEFQDTHFYQVLLSLGIKLMTLALQAPTLLFELLESIFMTLPFCRLQNHLKRGAGTL